MVGFINRTESEWASRSVFSYGIWRPDERELIGGCGLNRRVGPGGLEIGYWIAQKLGGRGYATAAARALTDEAFRLPDTLRVEIQCDEANVRSSAVPRRLGFRLDRVTETAIKAPGEIGRSMVWVLDRAEPLLAGKGTPK